MNIPRHWARATADVRDPGGRELELAAWGWSAANRGEAERKARERLDAMIARVRQGAPLPHGYGYGTRALREEIVQELAGPDGAAAGIVTRNGYGALVLNTARTMFVDVDLPEPPGALRRLFGGGAGAEAEVLGRLRQTLHAHSIGSFRVYRTAAGFRVLATDPLFTPGSPEAEGLMIALGADPAFVKLCRAQQSFRARLTPKPWRCERRPPPSQHPREDPGTRQAFATWLADYDAVCRTKATCRFVEAVGGTRVHREAAPLLDLHDRATRAGEPLPLA
ncbi:MAG TPA: hypothetical protein VGT02_18550 [Methylomirabilota bacterium]|nr:hypothetical protein [Methylomirabilota bacterium]